MSEESELEKQFWNSWVKDHIQGYDAKFVSHARDTILNSCVKNSDDRLILELGCGSESFFATRDAKQIFGLDISKNQLERYPHKPVLGDMKRFSFKEKFDIILFPASLHHCPEEYQTILRNVFEHLHEQGVLALVEPNLFHAHRIALRIGLVKTVSPGESPLNPLQIGNYITKQQKMGKCHFEYCTVYPASASIFMNIQRKILSLFSGFPFLHPLIYPWFFGVYQKF